MVCALTTGLRNLPHSKDRNVMPFFQKHGLLNIQGAGRGQSPPPPIMLFRSFVGIHIKKLRYTCKPTSMSFVPTKYLNRILKEIAVLKCENSNNSQLARIYLDFLNVNCSVGILSFIVAYNE